VISTIPKPQQSTRIQIPFPPDLNHSRTPKSSKPSRICQFCSIGSFFANTV